MDDKKLKSIALLDKMINERIQKQQQDEMKYKQLADEHAMVLNNLQQAKDNLLKS